MTIGKWQFILVEILLPGTVCSILSGLVEIQFVSEVCVFLTLVCNHLLILTTGKFTVYKSQIHILIGCAFLMVYHIHCVVTPWIKHQEGGQSNVFIVVVPFAEADQSQDGGWCVQWYQDFSALHDAGSRRGAGYWCRYQWRFQSYQSFSLLSPELI